MSIIYGGIQILGGLVLSVVVAIVGSVCFMFLFYNLLYVIRKVVLIASSFSFNTLNQRSTRVTKRNRNQNNVDYYEDVIHQFLDLIFKVKARNHKTCLVQKGEYYHKDSDGNSYQKGIDGTIPEVTNNPPNNEVSVHTDNLTPSNEDVNQKRTIPITY